MSNSTVTASKSARTLAMVDANIASARFYCVLYAVFALIVGALSLMSYTRTNQEGWLIYEIVVASSIAGASLYFSLKHRELIAERQSISS